MTSKNSTDKATDISSSTASLAESNKNGMNEGQLPEGPMAVVRAAGNQHVVYTGSRLTLNRLEAEVGSTIALGEVLAIQNGETITLGEPVLASAKVNAKIIRHFRGEKIIVFKKRRRKGYTKTQGHRQDLTEVQIEAISA